MKILINVGHPAHVHFFKNFIWKMQEKGHVVNVIAREKDISLYLLEKYGIKYVPISKHRGGLVSKLVDYLRRWFRTYKLVSDFRPDIMLGIASFNIAQVGFVLGIPSIIFDDTEHSSHEIALYKTFATKIVTPSCFTKDLGSKQIRYNGFHELAYLHPHYFKKDKEVLAEFGLDAGEKYSVVRFVSWSAGHDVGQSGISPSKKRELINTLSRHGKVYITSESELPGFFEQYRLPIPPEKIHHLLAYANLYVGESPTMTTESALLGVPAVCVNSWACSCGNFLELAKYGLLRCFKPVDFDEAIKTSVEILSTEGILENWGERREKLLAEKVDVTRWMGDLVEKFN